jgi:hypothetical protein
MATIPEQNHGIEALIDRHHEQQQEPPRPHMGASMLGHPCDRWLWLSFRWAVQAEFPGRILRLFRRGHLEERQIVSDLRAIGIDIRSTSEHQSRVDLGCHVSGSLDGIIESGVPEAPKARHVAEFKTHSLKSFEKLLSAGVEKSKPEHYIQMQACMWITGMDHWEYCQWTDAGGLDGKIVSVPRDSKLIDAFYEHLPRFSDELDAMEESLRRDGQGMPIGTPIDLTGVDYELSADELAAMPEINASEI